MQVRLITTMAGPAGTYSAGSVIELPDDQANDLIAGGYAVAHEAPGPAEAAAELPEETATEPAAKPRRSSRSKRSKSS